MGTKLIVIRHFAGKSPGEEITDPKDIQAVLDSEVAAHVVQVPAPDAPVSKRAKADPAE